MMISDAAYTVNLPKFIARYKFRLCFYKCQNFPHPKGYADAVFLILSSKLYWPEDWIYTARSCLSECTLRNSVCLCIFVIFSCFSKGQIAFLLCMLRKELAGRPENFYQVMVIWRVAPTTNRSTNFRAHHFEFGNSCFYLLWKSVLRT